MLPMAVIGSCSTMYRQLRPSDFPPMEKPLHRQAPRMRLIIVTARPEPPRTASVAAARASRSSRRIPTALAMLGAILALSGCGSIATKSGLGTAMSDAGADAPGLLGDGRGPTSEGPLPFSTAAGFVSPRSIDPMLDKPHEWRELLDDRGKLCISDAKSADAPEMVAYLNRVGGESDFEVMAKGNWEGPSRTRQDRSKINQATGSTSCSKVRWTGESSPCAPLAEPNGPGCDVTWKLSISVAKSHWGRGMPKDVPRHADRRRWVCEIDLRVRGQYASRFPCTGTGFRARGQSTCPRRTHTSPTCSWASAWIEATPGRVSPANKAIAAAGAYFGQDVDPHPFATRHRPCATHAGS